jgi:hypothetical protein
LLHPGSGSRIRGVKKQRIPDPTYFCIKAIKNFVCLFRIPDPDPTIAPSRIPDPEGKKAPDPGSATLPPYNIYNECMSADLTQLQEKGWIEEEICELLT